jgi:hypothetical protein
MRRAKHIQDLVQVPLNLLLGTDVSVRLLRVLCAAEVPLRAGFLAEEARVQRAGAQRVLHQLVAAGIAEDTGSGGRAEYQLNARHPLAKPLRDLFDAEAREATSLDQDVRLVLRAAEATPISVWLIPPSAGSESAQDAKGVMKVMAVYRSRPSEESVGQIRTGVHGLAGQHGIDFAARIVTAADLEIMDEQEWLYLETFAHVVAGLSPRRWRQAGTGMTPTHQLRDRQSRSQAELLSRKLAARPSLLAEIRSRLEHRIANASGAERHDLLELRDHLKSARTLRKLLEGEDETATRLRQSLPVAEFLTPAERARMEEDRG